MAIARDRQQMGIDLLFPRFKLDRSTSCAAVDSTLKTLKAGGTPHGFRTSFRTWVQDTEACGYDVAEMVLGHRVGGMVERTYARSDLLEQRRRVMDKWARYVLAEESVDDISQTYQT